MARKHLTATNVATLPAPASGRAEYFDNLLPGFFVRVTPSGERAYYIATRIGGRNPVRRFKIGPVVREAKAGKPGSLSWAREKARIELARAQAGVDIAAERRGTRAQAAGPETFQGASEEFERRHIEKLRPRTRPDYRRHMRVAAARWKRKPVREIGRAEIVSLLDDVADKSGPIAANRTFATLRKFFRWALNRGLIDVSPVAGLGRPSEERSRDRVLSDRELAAFWKATANLATPWGEYCRVLALTAQRRSEVAMMRLRDLQELEDGDKALWSLPAEATKAKRANDVPLAPEAVEILAAMPRFKGGEFVFSTTAGKKAIADIGKAKCNLDRLMADELREAAEGRGDDPEKEELAPWWLHDLRRSAATYCAKAGFGPHVVAAILNHSPGSSQGITAVYNRHKYRDEKRAALEAWASHLTGLTRVRPENVVELRA